MLGNDKKLIKNFILLALANFCFFTSVAAFYVLPVYLAKLNATKTYIGIAMGSTNIFQMLMIIILVNKIDFINKRKLLIYTSISAMILYSLYFFVANLYTIPILRSAQGLIQGIGFPVGMSLALDVIPENKRTGLLGLFGVSGALSNLSGPPIMELLMKTLKHNYAFFFPAVVSILWLVCLLFLQIDGKPKSNAKACAPFRRYYKIIPLAIFFGSLFGSFFSFVSDYCKEMGLTPYSIFFNMYAVALISIRFTFVKKLNIWDRKKIILSGFIAAVIALITGYIVNIHQNIVFIGAMGLLYGSGHGFLYPTLNVLFVDTTPERKGKATLTFIIFFTLGIGLSSLINGVVADLIGYPYMYLIYAVFATIITAFVFMNKKLFVVDKAAPEQARCKELKRA